MFDHNPELDTMARLAESEGFQALMADAAKHTLVVGRSKSACGACGAEVIFIAQVTSCPVCNTPFRYSVSASIIPDPSEGKHYLRSAAHELKPIGYGISDPIVGVHVTHTW